MMLLNKKNTFTGYVYLSGLGHLGHPLEAASAVACSVFVCVFSWGSLGALFGAPNNAAPNAPRVPQRCPKPKNAVSLDISDL